MQEIIRFEKLRILEHELVRILDMQRFPSQDIAYIIHHFFFTT